MFNEKLKDDNCIKEPVRNPKAPNQDGSHTTRTDLPEGLTVEKLQKCSTAEIDKMIKENGAGIGYANMIKLASGHGKTPAGTQYASCAFLINRAAELEECEAANASIAAKLRALPIEKLNEMLIQLEKQEQLAPPLPVLEAETVHETP